MQMDKATLAQILKFQKNEITEYHIYKKLSSITKDKNNSRVLADISKEELKHYTIWKGYSGVEVSPNWFKYWQYVVISFVFGVTFGVKLMESGEDKAQITYGDFIKVIPEAGKIAEDENKHETQLVAMIDEEKLRYVGSVVLGLNDALVELTGTLAGLTFALQNTRIIGVAGLITGIAASLSMAASEYLSTKTEGDARDPRKAAFYTLIAYSMAVCVLVSPYFIFSNYLMGLLFTLIDGAVLIFLFTYYYSVVKEISFKARFFEMLTLSFSVAGISFLIGIAVRVFLGIQI